MYLNKPNVVKPSSYYSPSHKQ